MAPIHDKFCWICVEEDTDLKCSKCIRSFHSQCVNGDPIDLKEQWVCSVCVKLEAAEHDDKQDDLDTLEIIVNRAFDDKKFNNLKYPLKSGSNSKLNVAELVVNPINLMTIKENLPLYSSFSEFLADVQWILHNCMIMFSDNHDKTKAAVALQEFFLAEIESVKKCSECYSNASFHPDSWFTMACTEPHLIIWAKMKGFTFWPAKLMSIDGQLINVRFFGDHTHADVPATNCYLYSKNNPNRSRNASVLYNTALKEAELYIANICEKFGSFRYANKKMVINPAHLGDYIVNMIPGVRKVHNDGVIDLVEDSLENTMIQYDATDDDLSCVESEDPLSVDGPSTLNDNADDLASESSDAGKNVVVALTRIDERKRGNQKRKRSKDEPKNVEKAAKANQPGLVDNDEHQTQKKRRYGKENWESQSNAQVKDYSKDEKANGHADASDEVSEAKKPENCSNGKTAACDEEKSTSKDKIEEFDGDAKTEDDEMKIAVDEEKTEVDEIVIAVDEEKIATNKDKTKVCDVKDGISNEKIECDERKIDEGMTDEKFDIFIAKPESSDGKSDDSHVKTEVCVEKTDDKATDYDALQFPIQDLVNAEIEPIRQFIYQKMERIVHKSMAKSHEIEKLNTDLKRAHEKIVQLEQNSRNTLDQNTDLRQMVADLQKKNAANKGKPSCFCGKFIDTVVYCNDDCRKKDFDQLVKMEVEARLSE